MENKSFLEIMSVFIIYGLTKNIEVEENVVLLAYNEFPPHSEYDLSNEENICLVAQYSVSLFNNVSDEIKEHIKEFFSWFIQTHDNENYTELIQSINALFE